MCYAKLLKYLVKVHQKVRKFATKIASRQNSVNQCWGVKFTFIVFGVLVGILGVLVGIFGVLVGVLGVLVGVLGVLVGVLGVLVGIFIIGMV